MNAGKEINLESSTHRILAVLLRYNENVDWLLQSNDSAEPILPTELYQAANIDPIGCVPSFPGMPNSSTSAESSSPVTWPYWATDYVAEKCKNANLVEPMTVFDIERQAWLDAGLPWDMEIGAKLNLGRRLHHENGENAFENSTPMTTEPLPTAKINVPSLSPLPLRIIPTQGRESLAYLTAIIDHYDDLPDLMLFMHAHDVSWHTFQLGQRWSLQRLKVIGPRNLSSGFMQLGCYKLDDAYMFTRVVDANFDLPDRFRESIVGHFMQAWTEPGGLGEIFGESLPPPYIRAACCATFAVEKKAILQRKKEFYEKLRNWALRTAMDKYWAGIGKADGFCILCVDLSYIEKKVVFRHRLNKNLLGAMLRSHGVFMVSQKAN